MKVLTESDDKKALKKERENNSTCYLNTTKYEHVLENCSKRE